MSLQRHQTFNSMSPGNYCKQLEQSHRNNSQKAQYKFIHKIFALIIQVIIVMVKTLKKREILMKAIEDKHRKEGDQHWNNLLGRYIQRAHLQEDMTIPRNLTECKTCSGVYDSKLIKRHTILCEGGAKQKNIYKSPSGLYFCRVCNNAPNEAQTHAKFKVHLASHSEEELLKQKYSAKDVFGKEGEKIILQLKAKVKEEAKLQEIKDGLKQPSIVVTGTYYQGEPLVTIKATIPNQVAKDAVIEPSQKIQLSDLDYQRLFFETHYYELTRFKQICIADNIYSEVSCIDDFSHDYQKYSYIQYDKKQLLHNTNELTSFKNNFKFMHLAKRLGLEKQCSLSMMIESHEKLELVTNKIFTTLSKYLILMPNQEVTQIAMLKLVEAVIELHENFIVHRNLNPKNILVEDEKEFKVLMSDFSHASSSTFTNTDTISKKAIYQNSKCQWPLGSHNHDLFSIGVLLLEQFNCTDQLRKQCKGQRELIEETKCLVQRSDINGNFKSIWEGTILKQDNLMQADQIFKRLTMYYSAR